jgi:hypothetical protein
VLVLVLVLVVVILLLLLLLRHCYFRAVTAAVIATSVPPPANNLSPVCYSELLEGVVLHQACRL